MDHKDKPATVAEQGEFNKYYGYYPSEIPKCTACDGKGYTEAWIDAKQFIIDNSKPSIADA